MSLLPIKGAIRVVDKIMLAKVWDSPKAYFPSSPFVAAAEPGGLGAVSAQMASPYKTIGA